MTRKNLRQQTQRKLTRQLSFIFRLTEGFHSVSGGMRAGSLSYTMLLSFIPFAISMLSITSWLPFSNLIVNNVEHYVFTTFLPRTGNGIYQQVKVFLYHSQRLPILGLIFLLISAYMMLLSIENHINQLWRTKRQRSFISSIVIDSLFMLLAPLIVCTAMYLRIHSYPLIESVKINQFIDSCITTFITIMAFTCVYKFIPSKKVNFNHALIAGIVGGIFFVSLKRLFIFYSSHFLVNYNLLYGSLAFFPLFLIWIYLCSLNLLFCAEIIYVLETKPTRKSLHKLKRIASITLKSKKATKPLLS